MKLNIGGGRTKYDGFLNCDYDINTNPDYVFNLETDVWPFEDNSVDEVIAHHIFEHFGEGYFHVLKELYRVCKDGAVLDIKVPHHRHDNFYHDPTHRRPITPYGLKLFDKQHNYYDESSSSKLGILYDVNFQILTYSYTLDNRCVVFDEELQNKSVHELEVYTHTKVNVLLETLITLRVCKSINVRELAIRELYTTLLNRKLSYEEWLIYAESVITADEVKNQILQSVEYKNLNGSL